MSGEKKFKGVLWRAKKVLTDSPGSLIFQSADGFDFIRHLS